MSNEYFQPGSVPAPNSPGSSAIMRNEFSSIAGGFDKLPVLAGHANEAVVINSTGTALVSAAIAIGDIVTLNGVQTLTNKTISWADNTFPGFGNAATRDAGLLAGNVLLLQNNNQLPPIDGSLLTGINAGMVSGVTQINQGGTGAGDVTGAQQNLGIDLKAPIQSPVFTGAPMAPTPPTGDASARLATTFFVTNTINAIGSVTAGSNLPLMDGVASAGNLSLFAASREDHVHPSDTSRAPASAATAVGTSFTPAGSIAATNVQLALQELDTEKAPLASPAFTGVPTAPTVGDPSDTTTKIATTAWVQQRLVQIPVGVQLSDMNAQNLGASPGPGVGVEASRWDHVHAFPIASQIPNLPAGTISATSVQGALNELDTEKSPVGHTHVTANITDLSAALIPFTPVSSILATNVQAAISEVVGETVPRIAGSGGLVTGGAAIPAGTTAERPEGVEGYFRRNTQLAQWEGYVSGAWVGIGQASAAGTPFTPSGNISATNVQLAIQELDTEKFAVGGPATSVAFTPSGNIAATNVQAAIQELDTETQAGLATKVSKSGDTISGRLSFSQESGYVEAYGSTKNFRVLQEVQSGEAINGLMHRMGLWYYPTAAWAGASIDFYRGTGASDGQLVLVGAKQTQIITSGLDYTFSDQATFRINGNATLVPRLSLFSSGVIEWQTFAAASGHYVITAPYVASSGMAMASTPGSGWISNSDITLKKDICPLTSGLEKVMGITPIRFLFNTEDDSAPLHDGFSAQNVQEFVPGAVHQSPTDDGKLGLDKAYLIPTLVAAIQELKHEIDDLRAQLAAR